MEGFPYAEGGLEDLFGAVTADGPAPEYHDWWAHDPAEERAAFEGFIDWLATRWRRDPSLHVYHYASYETSALKRLMGRYATREAEVDYLLRHGVFVDLYTVLRQAMVVGAPSYGLKDIERLYLPPRDGTVLSASGSVIEYQRWLDSGEPRRWEGSPILGALRDYNRLDCESTWGLRSWLLDRQRECGLVYVPESSIVISTPTEAEEPTPAEGGARLLERARLRAESDPENARLDELVGWLVGFHRREEKPMWWRMFQRHEMTVEERYDDLDCLAGLVRTDSPPRPIKRSWGLHYRYDPDQDTRLRVGSSCWVAGQRDLRCEIVGMDEDAGLVELKVGPGKSLPDRVCLIPDEYVSADTMKQAIARYAEAWSEEVFPGGGRSAAAPRANYRHDGGPLSARRPPPPPRPEPGPRDGRDDPLHQGPPGTGKTYAAASIISTGCAAAAHRRDGEQPRGDPQPAPGGGGG
jgi:uncharacterized protein